MFEAIRGWERSDVMRAHSSDSGSVVALALRAGNRRRALLANLRPEPQCVRMECSAAALAGQPNIELAPYAVEVLDWMAE